MDQMDDFEFKPLTDGLGFHKKNNEAGGSNATANFNDANINKTRMVTQDLVKQASAAASAFLSNPLPRQSQEIPKFDQRKFATSSGLEKAFDRPAPTQPTRTPIKNPITPPSLRAPTPSPISRGPTTAELYNKKLAELPLTNKGSLDFQDPQYVESAGHIGAYLFDFVVILGLSCLFALSLSIIAEIDLVQVVNTITFDAGIQIGCSLLIFSVIQLYLTLARSFFGCTLGEWAFDLQLGKMDQQAKTMYPILVFWRTAVTLATGMVMLPILSILLQKDMASRICGLKLYKQ